MRSHFVCPCLVLITSLACAGAAEGLTLTPAPEEQTGLKAIMEKWNAEELQRQGGKFVDHGWWPWGLTAFDFDNDGDLDLVPAHHGVPGGLLLKNQLRETGKLAFVDVTKDLAGDGRNLPGADDRPWAWDFDGDGWLDLGGFSDESKARSVLNQEGKKFIVAEFTFNPLSHAHAVEDLNGDGHPDLWGNYRETRLEFIYDASTKSFQKKSSKKVQEIAEERIPEPIRKEIEELKKLKNNRFLGVSYEGDCDLNGDGRKDVIVKISGGYGATIAARYLLAGEDGALNDTSEALGFPKEGCPILFRDLTGDGHVDILVAVGPAAGLYLNDGKGKFAVQPGELKSFLEKGGPYLLRAWPTDLDNDGDPDLVLSNPRLGNEQAYENEGGGKFRKVLSAGGWDANPIVICDINDDGLLDVCIGGPKDTISLYLAAAPKAGAYAKIIPRMDKPNPFAVGARVEIYNSGELGKDKTKPMLDELAHPDGTPVHAGLAAAALFDLRVTFPGKDRTPVETKGLAAGKKYKVTPDGKVEELK